MAYREDRDVEFLGKMKSEDLNDLVYCLTHDKDGELRHTEELTSNHLYKRYYPDHHEYWRYIAAEIQCFGANSIMTIFRGGKGVPYREVLTDVCDKMKVKYNSSSDVETIENALIMKILKAAIDEMSQDELNKCAEEAGLKNTNGITAEVLTSAFLAAFTAGGFMSYQITLIVVNAVAKALVGRGLALAGNAALTRVMSVLTGPIGWVITGLWTAIDIAGPAYRVTIPAVVYVIALRKKYISDTSNASTDDQPFAFV
ncbi:MAG: DUF3944 domain-containing protein [Bacilli bacterium]|nr:DUF3944 domain-containing protein [Bacilli bacterium]